MYKCKYHIHEWIDHAHLSHLTCRQHSSPQWGCCSRGAHRLLPGCHQLHAVHPALRRGPTHGEWMRTGGTPFMETWKPPDAGKLWKTEFYHSLQGTLYWMWIYMYTHMFLFFSISLSLSLFLSCYISSKRDTEHDESTDSSSIQMRYILVSKINRHVLLS